MSVTYHTALPSTITDPSVVETRLAALDQAIVDRQANITTETSRATGAEAALSVRATAIEDEIGDARGDESTLQNRINVEVTNRTAADALEVANRGVALAAETAGRSAGDTGLLALIQALQAIASTSGGTAITTLTRNAGAATIASIGGDGTTTTITTTASHGFTDGDFLTVSGTTNYNGDTAAINVLSTNQFTYLSGVNAATETVGSARTKRLFVASTTPFTANQQITLTSNSGRLHTTTVSGTPSGGIVTLTDAVPATWTGTSNRASSGNMVSSTIEEVRLARSWLPGSPAGLTLPQVVQFAAQNTLHVTAFGATGDGVTDDRAAIQAAITAAAAAPHQTVWFPSGTYVIASKTGTGNAQSSLLVSGNNVTLRGAPGATILVKDGAALRPLIARNCSGITIEGLKVVYARTDGVGGSGICVENSSDVVIRGNTADGWPLYGICVSEDTSAFSHASSNVSFTAPHTVSNGTDKPFGPVVSGQKVLILNSANNNGLHTVDVVAGDGSSFTVVETVTTEAAGASLIGTISNNISFVSGTKLLTDANQGLLGLFDGDRFQVSGSVRNDGIYTVDSIGYAGRQITTVEPLLDETIGNTITITKIGRPTVKVMIETACNNVLIENNNLYNCRSWGINTFPKVLSRNHTIRNNYCYNCGTGTSIGGGLKVGQACVGAQIFENSIERCRIGIAVGNWETLAVINNSTYNCEYPGVSITCSDHPTGYSANFQALLVANNQIAHGIDPDTGLDYVANPLHAAINFNGLRIPNGPVDILSNQVRNWGNGGGFSVNRSSVPYANLRLSYNTFLDSGASLVTTYVGKADMTSGSDMLTNVQIQKPDTTYLNSTAGFYVGQVLQGTGLATGTTIIDVNPSARTIRLSTVAISTATGSDFETAWPEAMEVSYNKFIGTKDLATAIRYLAVRSPRAKVIGNIFENHGPFALQIRGDGMQVERNEFSGHNPRNDASNAPIFIDRAETYTLVGNRLISLYPGNTQLTPALIWNNNAGGLLATVYADKTNTTYGGGTQRLLHTGAPLPIRALGQLGGTASWNPAPLTNGAVATTTISVSGANVGDPVKAGFTSITATGWSLRAHVLSPGVVTVELTNNTGGTVDLPSGTLTVLVDQF
jgi:hypothetical protein